MTSKLGHTSCGRGGEQADVCEAQHTQIQAKRTGTDVRVAALKFLGVFSPGRSYHSDLVSYSCLTLEFPLGIEFSFLFGFSCLSTHCLPQPRYLFLNQQVPSLYTFALSKWKHTEWVKSLFKSCWRPKGHPREPICMESLLSSLWYKNSIPPTTSQKHVRYIFLK